MIREHKTFFPEQLNQIKAGGRDRALHRPLGSHQDSVDAVLVQRDHPVEASDLVVAQLSVLDEVRRVVELDERLLGVIQI